MTKTTSRAALTVRNANPDDIPGLIVLSARAYPDLEPYTASMLLGQMSNYPDGQFVVEYEGEIVGYAASFKIDEDLALAPHTWATITGGGYAARHNPNGAWLYGMEVCVHPERRRLRIG